MEIRFDITRSLWENVQDLHERLKKLRKKRERLLNLIEEEKSKGNTEETEKEKKPVIKKKRKREWYESFRWMITSGGYLVIGGKDARTNEIIVKRYLEPKDLFFHADVVGAPSVVMKNGIESEEKDRIEAATFAAVYSRAWKMGLYRVPVFYTESHQVSLSPPSGEYRPKGGVIIKGKRHWLEVENKIYLGYDGVRFFVSVYPRTGVRYLLLPGKEDKDSVADKIIKELNLDKEQKGDLIPLLPPGGIEIRRVEF